MSGWNRGKGAAVKFLRDHVGDPDGPCLIWPFCRLPTGYGIFGFEGENLWAHRFMCELANDPPPTPEHQAAHSCGRGAHGCVHPRHLEWKTRSKNQMDRHEHGTITQWYRWRPKLTQEQVAEIRALKGQKTQQAIADIYGVTRENINIIHAGRSHRQGNAASK